MILYMAGEGSYIIMATLAKDSFGIDVDINLLRQYLHCEKISGVEKNNITSFKVIQQGYLSTNEKLDLYYAKKLESKRVLSVTSSGDHILHAVLGGAKDITGFDINRVAKYFSALKIAMVKRYDHDEFVKKINYIYFDGLTLKGLKEQIYFDNILKDVSNYLSMDENVFWHEFINILKDNKNGSPRLFYDCGSYYALEEHNAWASINSYLKLKENLQNCNITYIDSNVNNLVNKTDGKFDLIYLSNILGRMSDVRIGKEVKLLIYLRKLLNKNGVIYDYDWYPNLFSKSARLKLFYDVEHEILEYGYAYVYKYIRK